MIALDTNLLVYDFHLAAPEQARARVALNAAAASGRGWGFTLASAVEFWNIVTRPAAPLGAATEARAYLLDLCRAGAQFWQPLPEFGWNLLASAAAVGIRGRRIFDWQIALTALAHGATELWTHDRSFRAPSALRIIDPLADS